MRIRVFVFLIFLIGIMSHAHAQDTLEIVEIEYFFDNDPGFGNCASFTITADTVISLTDELVQTDTLKTGFHVFYMRARNINALEVYYTQDSIASTADSINLRLYPDSLINDALRAAGTWGITESRIIFVDQSFSVDLQTVDTIEYFFDKDPGYGQGIIIDPPDFTAGNSVTLGDFTLSTDTLSTGFHVLFMRAKAQGGAWGASESRIIYVDQSSAAEIQVIDSLEYFIDVDPGYGHGVIIDAPDITAGTTVNLTDFTLATDTLKTGFHILFMRAKAEGGAWGIPESRIIFIDQSSSAEIQILDSIEYFFDIDPGYGNGIVIDNFTQGTDISLPSEILSSDTLVYGFHVLFMRAKAVGGAWGFSESRVVFIDQSDAGAIVLVDSLEYFWDIDPGIGNGAIISLTASNVVSLDSMLNADTLSLGFHILGMRAKAANGPWGATESRTIFVDPIGVVSVVNVTDLEYFFDADPGYGNGTTIPIAPPAPNPIREIALAAGALAEGQHTVHVRARDENGQWGPYESAAFSAYGPGRELDSAALAYVYKQLSGATWNNTTNWLTGNLDTWYGVDVVNTRVDSVKLSGNGLAGELPLEMGYVLNLKKLDLSNNLLIDTVDAELANLSLLEELDLHNNRIDELADLSGITSLNTIHLDTNFFDFGDLEPYVGVATFTYENQRVVNDIPTDSTAKINAPLVIDKTIDGAENNFQWYLNDVAINGADLEDYTLTPYLPADSGVYVLKVTNNIVTGLELVTEPYHLGISDFEEDSLALVSLYNNSNGANWSLNTNWLTGDLSTWNGVIVQNQRVTDLNLPGNNLDGFVPKDFGYADSLVNVDLSNNQLRDSLPDTWEQFYALTTANLANNDFISIPNLKLLNVPTHNLTTLSVEGNKLQFGDIETNFGIGTFTYVPQDSVGAYRDTLFDAGTPSSLIYSITGSNNTYQWYRADDLPPHTEAALAGENTDTYTIANPIFEDEDWYRLEINSNVITDLTLTTAYVNLGISSLKRDSTALLRLYDSTNGDGWIDNTNWGTGNIIGWTGVTLNGAQDRVIGLALPGNNLDGPVPAKFRDITKIETVDLSNNEITDLPNMSFMTQLTTLDLSQNRLGFGEIEYNLPLSGFEYSNQKNIRIPDPVRRLQFGTDDSLKVKVSGTQNEYQWHFEQFQNAVATGPVDGATSTDYFLDSINYYSMGKYHLKVTSPAVPDLELRSDDFNMIAVTDIYGNVNDPDLNPYPKGDVIVLGIVPDGPYLQLDTAQVDANSEYLSQDVDLGDYLLLTRPNFTEDPLFIQTYIGSSIYWIEADTLRLRQPLSEGIEINIKKVPPDPELGTAEISGIVDTDFPESGRVDLLDARQRAKRAGCSVRRFRGAGRFEDWELFAYVESDDNGQFTFPELPDGLYLFNVEYPGIPMNPQSDIELEVKPGAKLNIEAIITENTITVNDLTLGLPRTVGDLKLYPNPTDGGKTRLDYRIDRNIKDFELKIWTISGQQVHQEMIPHTIGNQSVTLDVSHLKEGLYLLHMEDSGQNVMIQMKMIVKH
ncbi:MAG: T9SS type A sorting domain-containing protein [Bacteroidota bacterium]